MSSLILIFSTSEALKNEKELKNNEKLCAILLI